MCPGHCLWTCLPDYFVLCKSPDSTEHMLWAKTVKGGKKSGHCHPSLSPLIATLIQLPSKG